MKYVSSLLFIIFAGTKLLFAQSELVGSKLETIGLTEFLKNEPEDKNLDNKYKVLEFWASWCAPCLAAVPHINQLKNEFAKNKELVFVSITYETPEMAGRALKKVDFQSIVATDQSKQLFRKLWVEKNGMISVPATILIDARNVVRWVGSPRQLNAELITKFLAGENLSEQQIKDQAVAAPKQFMQTVLTQNSNSKYLKTAFVLSEAQESEKKSTMMNGLTGLYVFSKVPLRAIFSSLLRVPEYKIVFEDTAYNSTEYNVFYKNGLVKKENFTMETYSNEMLVVKQKIAEGLGLKESIVPAATAIFELQVKEGSKLQVSAEQEGMSRLSSDEGVLSIVNYNLKDVAAILSKTFGLIISYNGEDSRKYDFTILHKKDLESLVLSMESYGIEVMKGSEIIEYYRYENIE